MLLPGAQSYIMKASGKPPWGEHSANGEPLQKRPVLMLPPSGPLENEAREEGPQKMISGSYGKRQPLRYYGSEPFKAS